MRPLLAHIYEPHRVTYPCYVQPKLNGIRALYQNGRFQSRDQLPFPDGLLSHLAEPLKAAFDPSVILDGELYVHGWPLQRINAAVTPVRQHPTEDTLKVEYHVFDSVEYCKPFESRFGKLASISNEYAWNKTSIQFVRTIHCGTETLANELYAQFVSLGYEGMMYRLGDCPYTSPKQLIGSRGQHRPKGASQSRFLSDKNNRVWHLLKRKDWQDDEFVCIGTQEGEGKYAGTLGALVCKTKSGNQFHVGSGLTDADRDHYWQNVPLGRLIKVKYLVLSSAGIPLNPTILAIL
jgi:DNA ligase-1